MGLDASVMCKCFFDKKAAEPPVPLDWLCFNESGYIDVCEEHDSDEVRSKVFQWMGTACPHPGMLQACEHVTNWTGFRVFKLALIHAGSDNFPTLWHELYGPGGGFTLPDAAARALPELARFRLLKEVGHHTCLVETATGQLLCRHLGHPAPKNAVERLLVADDGVYSSGGPDGKQVGVDPAGLYVKDQETCLFRSLHCRQSKIPGTRDDMVELEDLNGGGSYRGRVAIYRLIDCPDDHARLIRLLPTEMHVEPRVVTPADLEYILGPLEILFQAAVETGNPVRWN